MSQPSGPARDSPRDTTRDSRRSRGRTVVSRMLLAIAAVAASVLLPAAAVPAVAAPAVAASLPSTGEAIPLSVVRTADVNDFSFQSMDVDYTLGRDKDGSSTLRVVETFVASFPQTDQNHGMRRSIPDSYNGQPLFPELVSITDGNGVARAAETDDDDGTFIMTSRADGFVHGSQTYVFTYTLRNVTWHFENTDDDEFYWDVNGVAWPQTFGRVSASLHVEPALAKELTGRNACYHGPQGSTQTCPIGAISASDGSASIAVSIGDVPAFQTLTMAVGFRPGTFTLFDSSFLASPWGWVQGVAGVGMLGALVFAIVMRRRRLRDDPGRPTIIAEYTPPAGVDALQSAVLLGQTTKAIPAEVLEQAVGGSIRILEGGRRAFGGYKLQAQLVDPSRADGDGRMLLEGLFGDAPQPGAVFEFGRTDTRFSRAAQKIIAWATAELGRRGLRRPVPARARALPILFAVVLLALVVITGFIALGAGVRDAWPIVLMVAAGASFFAVIALVSRRPLSAAGSEVRDHLEGLRVFIEWAEADRIRMLQSPAGAERVRVDTTDSRQVLRLYETLLPYAVVFGQEKQWAAQLVVLYSAGYGAGVAPYWYVGTHGFDASAFSAGIGSLSASASSSSSTSRGSGGGGSAGGGGGGGGGGGV